MERGTVRRGETAVRVPMLIGGKCVEGSRWTAVINPARPEEVVGSIPRGDAGTVDQAAKAAHAAFPRWSAMPVAERASRLRKAAQALSPRVKEFAPLLVRENGKLLREAEIDILRAIESLELAASLVEEFLTPERHETKEGTLLVSKRPRGVTAVISPWNFPIILTFRSLAPALATGNTAVVKPPTTCPLTLGRIVAAVAEHLPPGVLNLVTGSGGEVGKSLVTHPEVSAIAFTGSTQTGREVMRDAAASIKKLALELGGNDPAIVLDDCPMEESLLQRMIRGVFTASGQVCFAVKRIYVHAGLYRDFVARFTAAADQIVVGDGLNPQATMGALNNEPQLTFVRGLIAEARKQGAKVEEVGKKLEPAAWGKGYFHLPTIVTGADHSFRVVSCEQFGPVIPIMPFTSLDEAVRLANDTEYGLRSSVWTASEEKGLEVARRLEAGITFLNNHSFLDRRVNFPGVKQSGLGRESLKTSLEEYVDCQGISIPKA